MKTHWSDVSDLACEILGMPLDSGQDEIEYALANKYEISFESFHKVINDLLPFTIPAKTAFEGKTTYGFVKDGAFICKAAE